MRDETTAQQEHKLIQANKELFAEVEFALEVQTFLGSPVGKYIIQRAEVEREAGVNELIEVAPHDIQRIMTLQSQVKRAESIQRWLAEAIQIGLGAKAELEAQDRAQTDEE